MTIDVLPSASFLTRIKSNRIKFGALLLSLFIHLLLLYTPSVSIPKLKKVEKEKSVKVSLLPLPTLTAPAPPKRASAPAKSAGVSTAHVSPEPSPKEAPSAELKTDESTDEGDETASAIAPPPRLPLPEKGQTIYTVYIGENNFEVGRAVHAWEIGERTYKLTIEIDTTGIARVVNRNRYIYSSEGKITAEGFRPDRYVYQEIHQDRGYKFSADFDWENMLVRTTDFVSHVRQYELEDNTHDFATTNYQLSAMRPQSENIELNLIRLDKLEKNNFENMGEEIIEAAGTSFKTIHMRKKTDNPAERRELWLAPDLNYLPIKILWSDKDYVYVQLISQMENTLPQ
ncbi:MAG: DUF3108 domain-containing protein [Burkholderiales bacterium]|nr:DUF3108 domain-containing protein [Burkholderiales bacterium]